MRRKSLVLVLVATFSLHACVQYRTRPIAEVGTLTRAETRSEGGVRVAVAVPSAEESEQIFGTALESRGIQPVWLRIANAESEPYWLMPLSMDAAYYSPYEAAYESHFTFSPAANHEMDLYFNEQQIPIYVPPNGETSGFVFTHLDWGTKYVVVQLVGDTDVRTFTFVVPIPGMEADYMRVDFDALYPPDEIVSLDPEALRAALSALPCCTTDQGGGGQGDPLNIVVIGEDEDVWAAFIGQGWDETETLHGASLWRTVKSFLFGSPYRYSPVSPLYVYGRHQDVALQKARNTVDQRNHLRLWLAPLRFEGKPVWVGQISRDIGVRFTLRTWNLTTHKIDPDVDEARGYLVQDLLMSQALAKLGYVSGVEAATPEHPEENLTGDPWFSDGLRAVFVISSEPVAYSEVEYFDWEEPPER